MTQPLGISQQEVLDFLILSSLIAVTITALYLAERVKKNHAEIMSKLTFKSDKAHAKLLARMAYYAIKVFYVAIVALLIAVWLNLRQ